MLKFALVIIVLFLASLGANARAGDDQIEALIRKTDRQLAPSFDGAVGWINTEKPLKLSDLKGKIVLLDFWTFG